MGANHWENPNVRPRRTSMTTPKGKRSLNLMVLPADFDRPALATLLPARKIKKQKEGQKNSRPPLGENQIPKKKLS